MSDSPAYDGNAEVAKKIGMKVPGQSAINMQDFRGVDLYQPHRFQDVLKTGNPLIGIIGVLGSIEVLEVVAKLGYDFMFLDAEHTPMSNKEMAQQVRVVHHYSEGRTACVVRVPTHGHEWVAWALDSVGQLLSLSYSVLIWYLLTSTANSQTETKEQAEAAVRHSNFPPQGIRSCPPGNQINGVTDGVFKDHLDLYNSNNRSHAVIMQIESKEGAERVEEIAAVPGVHGLCIGNLDLAMSLGVPRDKSNPIFSAAVDRILAAAKHNGLSIMDFSSSDPQRVSERLEQGCQMIVTGSDLGALTKALGNQLAEVRETVMKRGL